MFNQATVSSELSNTDSISIASLWIGRLDLYSSFFLGVCALILAFIGFLTWKNHKQKEDAEKLLIDIKNIHASTANLNKQLNNIMTEAKKAMQNVNSLLQKTSQEARGTSKEVTKILEEAKGKKAEIEAVEGKMAELNRSIEISSGLASGASGYIPSIGGSPIGSVPIGGTIDDTNLITLGDYNNNDIGNIGGATFVGQSDITSIGSIPNAVPTVMKKKK
jgi:hypothetical protein